MQEELDIGKLKSVKFSFAKGAFQAKSMHCNVCNSKTKKVNTVISLPESSLSVNLNVFRCTKCNKEYLNFEEAKKLDKALIVSRAMRSDSYKMRKSLSFDGDSYIFRIPAEVARSLGKKPHADMTPLSSRELLIHLGNN